MRPTPRPILLLPAHIEQGSAYVVGNICMQDRGGVIFRAQGWNDDDGKGEGKRNRRSRRKITCFFASSLIWALLPLLRTGLILEAPFGVSKVRKKMEGGGLRGG